MSINELQTGELRRSGKGSATGFIKGTVTNRQTNEEYKFNADGIWRDEQEGTLRFHGSMVDPENPANIVGVALQLIKVDTPSGTYRFDSEKVLHLSYFKQDVADSTKVHYYKANRGDVELINAYPDKPISGKLGFNAGIMDDRYRVDVEYSITKF
ncbi:hypothetical protein ACYZT7_15785 [Pseudomonas sp. RT4P38]